jgi:hypothetical protein
MKIGNFFNKKYGIFTRKKRGLGLELGLKFEN